MYLSKLAPTILMGIASVITLVFTPTTVIDSDIKPKEVVEQDNNQDNNVSVASMPEGLTKGVAPVSSSEDELPSVDLPVVEVKVVNENIEKVNNITVDAPVLGQIGVKGFKTVSLGNFKVEAFCGGKCCNQGGDTKGMRNYEGVNVATDPNVIPYGTMLLIDGVGIRQSQPSTQKVSGNVIKVYVSNHNKVNEFKVMDVAVKKII